MTGLRLGARLWWGAVPLVLLLWGTGALVATALPGLPVSGLVPTAAVPLITFGRDVALALAAGAAAVSLLCDSPSPRRWALGWGAIGLALVVVSLAALRADIDAGSQAVSLGDVVRESGTGRALVAQVAVLLVALGLVAAGGRWPRILGCVAMATAVALAPLGGHAGLAGPHSAAGVAIGLHVAAASVWAGGLAVTAAVVVADHTRAHDLLPRFSTLALACVVVAAEGGLLSASLLVESVPDLLGTAYGSIVLAKGALLAWLIWLGWQQRRRVLDRLPDSSVPVAMAAIAAVELVVMGVAIGAGVVLSRIGPSPIPGAGFAPVTLVVLGLAIPMLAVLIRPRGWRVSDGLPEAAAVVLLVVIVEVGGVGLVARFLGPLGLMVEAALLLAAGWVAVSAARVRTGGLIVLAIGLPVALPLAAVLADRPGTVRMSVAAVIIAEVMLAAWWNQRRRTRAVAPDAVVSVAG